MIESRGHPDAEQRPPVRLAYRTPDVRDARRAWTRADEYSSGLSLFLFAAFALGPAVIVGTALGVHWLKTAVTIVAACAGAALYAGLRYGRWRVGLGLLVGTTVSAALLGALALMLLGSR